MENYEVKNDEIQAVLKDLGHDIKSKLPQGWEFALFLMSAGLGGATFYISSADRPGVVGSLKEFIAKNDTPKV